jgi:uncharacterized membrane protein
MKLNNDKIFNGILFFGLTTILLVLFDVQYFYLGAIFSFVFLTTIPGLLIMLMLKIRKIGYWEYLVYTIGLSIAFLMFAGLGINWLLPWLNITDKPLSLMPLLASFDIILSTVGFIAYKRNKDISLEIKFPKLDSLNKFFFAMPVVFLALSILGAIRLNNGGSNILTLIMLGEIAVYIILVVLFRDKLNKNVFPWAILFSSISLLLMYSMRSWYVSGHDILTELRVFELTKNKFYWSALNLPGNAYNGCLSITILPTIMSSFLKINDQIILKLINPLIFSLVPVVTFLFLKRYFQRSMIFIAVFFLIAQPIFSIEMPMEGRQSVALLFFTLSILMLFDNHISLPIKRALFIFFGSAMVVSHYSTSYIAVAFFVLVCITVYFYKIYIKHNAREVGVKREENNGFNLRGYMVLSLVLFSIVWYSLLTNISGNIVDVVSGTVKNIDNIFKDDMRQEGTTLTSGFDIFFKQKDSRPLLKDYVKKRTIEYANNPINNLYSYNDYNSYNAQINNSDSLSLGINRNLAKIIYILSEAIKKAVKLFISIGVLCLFFRFKKEIMDIEYKILCFIALSFVYLMIILPYISTGYSVERLYIQLLPILLIPLLLGGSFIFNKVADKKFDIFIMLSIFIFFYLFSSGFIPQFIGGTGAVSNLNNFGKLYDTFYTHRTEVRSAEWISENIDKKNLIYADIYAHRKLLAFGNVSNLIAEDILPSTIDKNAYVYLDYRNSVERKASIQYSMTSAGGGVDISYNFPNEFLDGNKDKIYNNGSSEIYK